MVPLHMIVQSFLYLLNLVAYDLENLPLVREVSERRQVLPLETFLRAHYEQFVRDTVPSLAHVGCHIEAAIPRALPSAGDLSLINYSKENPISDVVCHAPKTIHSLTGCSNVLFSCCPLP